MQIVIDIPNEEVPNKQEIIDISLHFIAGEVCECSYPYIILPENPTNGDMVRAIFNYRGWTAIKERMAHTLWWNAPYEKEDKNDLR